MADIQTMSPGEETLVSDILAPSFKLGVARGHWRLHSRNGLILLIELSASDGRWYGIRCDCQNYPTKPPYVTSWLVNENRCATADERPNSRGELGLIFRMDWENGKHLYHPMSRKAIESHPGWKTEMQQRLWQPEQGVEQLLSDLHDCLHSTDYQPINRAAA